MPDPFPRLPVATTAVAGALVVMIVAVVVVRWAILPFDLRPPGDECAIERDPGSGTSDVGTERIDWGLLPERVCVTDTGEIFSGRNVDGALSDAGGIALAAGFVLVAGVAGGAASWRAASRRAQ